MAEKNKINKLDLIKKTSSNLNSNILNEFFAESNFFKILTELKNNVSSQRKNTKLADEPLISLQYIEKILPKLNSFLFDNSTSEQWSNLFNETTLKNPIIVNKKATKKDIRYFFDELVSLEIINQEYIKKLVDLKAIKHKYKLLNYRTLKDAKQDIKKGFSIIKFNTQIDACLDIIR